MPTILLVRHGQASFGTEDYDRLSDLGHRQAVIVAESLASRGLAVHQLRSGSLRRQRETAVPLADRLNHGDLPAQIDAGWNEYDMNAILAAHSATPARADASRGDGGSTSTSTSGEAKLPSAAFQDALDAGLTRWIAAREATTATESWPDFEDRTSAALADLTASLGPGQTGVAVTSGGVIAALCARLLGLTTAQLLHFNRVAVNTAITKIAVGRRGLSLIAVNDHSHLERAGASLVTYR